jgi:hypothetical protein
VYDLSILVQLSDCEWRFAQFSDGPCVFSSSGTDMRSVQQPIVFGKPESRHIQKFDSKLGRIVISSLENSKRLGMLRNFDSNLPKTKKNMLKPGKWGLSSLYNLLVRSTTGV